MSDIAERLRMLQAGALAGAPDLSLSMPGQQAVTASTSIAIPGESEQRPLRNEQERITALNKLGEALRAPSPAAPLHEFCRLLSVIAAESIHDNSIEARKAIRGAVANLYGFSERIR